ncbi:hypothetical protein HG535_0A05990 [Zygotorulaspora mrakii]|uniref:N-acetyltransferase domain-containing protein n=1 Tax=Zygotorulaspora mrakii TaxID=42260 RepID=A0A7H9AWZ2_ZYGMR|nr:uncharacterized protein HG535_0A05990 [Zygotorulaspora mrakii]QLG70657.1 hypothetical protein HG535_0A05990 [Zygotorulaspora mrakii]
MSTTQLRNGPKFSKPLVDVIEPLQFQLKDSDTIATAFPIYSSDDVPLTLLQYMHNELNLEIEDGKTYPHLEQFSCKEFSDYWFSSFCVIVLKTNKLTIDPDQSDWSDVFQGTFYIKPNYLPRCSHNCNAGFLVNHKQRNQRIGYRLAQVYLKWAPLLGYKYSVFNLVFVTNKASWRIWDQFKFDRVGIIPGAAVLKNIEEPVDAIIFGKDLTKIEPELFSDFP